MMMLIPLVLGANLTLVADQPPRLNVDPSCEASAQSGPAGRTKQICLDDENRAKTTLTEQWTTFNAAERSRCTSLVSMGGSPSYVELLTCLEISKQVKALPADDTLKPAGMKPGR